MLGVVMIAPTASATYTDGGDDDCTTAYSGWVTQSPGEGWVKIDTRTVTDKAAYDDPPTKVIDTPAVPADPAVWANFSPNDSQGHVRRPGHLADRPAWHVEHPRRSCLRVRLALTVCTPTATRTRVATGSTATPVTRRFPRSATWFPARTTTP